MILWGEVRRLENTSEMVGGNFMRFRVAIDISQPLCRGRIISLDGSCENWISFKYERLPNICYGVGGLLVMLRIVLFGSEVNAL